MLADLLRIMLHAHVAVEQGVALVTLRSDSNVHMQDQAMCTG